MNAKTDQRLNENLNRDWKTYSKKWKLASDNVNKKSKKISRQR